MAVLTETYVQFLAPGVSPSSINLVLTANGIGATSIPGAYNIEIFTSSVGTIGPGFQASAFIPNATTTGVNTEVVDMTITPIEQLLSGSVSMEDLDGPEAITDIGSNNTIIGSNGDTIVGGAGAGQTLNALSGTETVIQGSSVGFVIYAGAGASIFPTASPPGASGNIVLGAQDSLLLNPLGTYTISSAVGAYIIANNSAATALIAGATGDQIDLSSSSGNNTIIGASGGERVYVGSGNNLVIGASGDTIAGGSGGSWSVVDAAGGMDIIAGSGASGIIGQGGATAGAGSDTISSVGNGSLQVTGAVNDFISLTGNGNSTITGAADDTIASGQGNTTIIGALGDSIMSGRGAFAVGEPTVSSNTIVDSSGGMRIVIAVGVPDVLIGGGGGAPGPGDTITSANSGANVSIAAGAGDIIALSDASDRITAGNNDQISLSLGSEYVDASAGADAVTLTGQGGGLATVIGTAPTVAGQAGDTITVNSYERLSYGLGAGSAGAGHDLINMMNTLATTVSAIIGSGNTKVGVVNIINAAFTQDSLGNITTYSGIDDTIISGNSPGSASLFGSYVLAGDGDRVGVGSVGASILFGTITDLWDHPTIAGGSVAFGTNDPVNSVNYSGSTVAGQGTSVRSGTNGSFAQVTVTNFNGATDSIFYQNEQAATTQGIIASSRVVQVQGQNSTVLTLPDGTQMTLFGYAPPGGLSSGIFKP
ncbi:MAG: hypothetical protein JO001_11125 [Alphaproteobacteria bacterium]|nr:hypothetical protein [Alphaproteobacteria bacterium]